MWIGAGSSRVGDYLIPLRGFALPFFVTQTLEEGPLSLAAPRGAPGPRRLCIGPCLLRDVRQTEGAHRKSK